MENPQDPNSNPQDLGAPDPSPQPAPQPVVNLAGPSAQPAEPLPDYQEPSQPAAAAYPDSAPNLQASNPEAGVIPENQPPAPTESQVTGSVGAPPPPTKGKKLKFALIGLVALLLLAVGAYFLLNRLGGSPQATSDPVTLNYWGLWDSQAVMQPLIEEYQKQNSHVTINYEQRPISNHYTTVRSRIQSGSSSGTMPDIVRIHSSWVPVLKSYLSPLPNSVLSASQYEENQYPVAKDTLLQDGSYYAMASSIDGLALIYNQDLFNEAGITSVPVTWDDVRQAATQITRVDDRGNISIGGMAMGNAANVDHFAEIIGLLMAQNGVEPINANGEVVFDKAFSADGRNLGAEALAFYTLFTTSEKVWDNTMESSSLAFSKGQVGMILAPSWRIPTLIEQNPQLSIGVAPAPQLVADRQVGYASYWVEAVPAAGPNQAEAWKFVTWLSQPDQQARLNSSVVNARTLAMPPANPQSASLVSMDSTIAPFIVQAPGYRASIWANNTGSDELNEAINSSLAAAIQSAQTSGNREAAAASALEAAAAEITETLTSQR